DDIQGIVELIGKVGALGKDAKGRRPQLRVSVSTFVPKPHTPFQWVAQESETQITAKQELLLQGLRRKGVKPSWTEPELSLLEAVLSRGDRRLGKVIYNAWQMGARFDAWNECFDFSKWLAAFEKAGLEMSFYAHRERPLDEVLPWSHIDIGVTPAFLKREYQRAVSGKETADCRFDICNACGLEQCQPTCRQKLSKKAAESST
ncbi:MAG: B12-binding domain-containing radical SAM protein, partial [Chloroflexota bacterium]|nr:B12-binding domain-containing radical SAM protein [Chloroflexota bacterium]